MFAQKQNNSMLDNNYLKMITRTNNSMNNDPMQTRTIHLCVDCTLKYYSIIAIRLLTYSIMEQLEAKMAVSGHYKQ